MSLSPIQVLCVYPTEEVLANMALFQTMVKLSGNFVWRSQTAESGDFFDEIEKYDVVLLDLKDAACDFYEFSQVQQQKLISFLRNGKSLLIGHDHFNDSKIHDPEIYRFAGFEPVGDVTDLYTSVTVAPTASNHPILSAFFDFKNLPTFPVAETHNNKQVTTDAEVILKSSDGLWDYLIAREDKETGARVVLFNGGHTGDLTNEEQMLYVNVLVWLARREKK